MNEESDGPPKNLEEVLKYLLDLAWKGDFTPSFIGMMIIVPQGGIPPSPHKAARGDSTETEIEVHRIDDRITLVTELPGMSRENIQVLFRGDRVFIWAHDQERQYRADQLVPPAVKDSVEIRFRHGVLEVSYLAEEPACPNAPPSE
jgi:HSP20 family molecular chaperone IbpA